MKRICFAALVSFIFVNSEILLSQPFKKIAIDTFAVSSDNIYEFRSLLVVPQNIHVYVNGVLIDSAFYKINFEKGFLCFSQNMQFSPLDTIIAIYYTFELDISRDYFLYKSVIIDHNDNVKVVSYKADENKIRGFDDFFGKDLQKSGYIYRGFTLGSNRDLSLNSGLSLTLNGKISEDIEINAVLSEENIPIQPEGTTQNLQEIDRIFIKIKSSKFESTIGDFDFNYSKGDFSKVSKKSRGVLLETNVAAEKIGLVYSNSKGKYHSVAFNGIDGVQGPYRLYGQNGERDIVVLAGTEKVYLNGKKLIRGEENDYIIDYAMAEIKFTAKNLISSFSRIYVEYEYADMRYSRSFLAGYSNLSFFDNKLKINLIVANESDLKNSSLGFDLTNDDKKILKLAGANRELAYKSGVRKAEDSLTRGIYKKIDTLIGATLYSYYKYAPGEDSSRYFVEFSFVGDQKGDYKKIAIGVYEFVGIGAGDYMPIIFIPMPQSFLFGDVRTTYEASKYANLDFELSAGQFDANTFSDVDNYMQGYAYNIGVYSKNVDVNWGNINFGKIKYFLKERKISPNFKTFENYNSAEFEREFNLQSFKRQNSYELLREGKIEYQPINSISVNYAYFSLRRADEIGAIRNTLSFKGQEIYNLNVISNFNFVDSRSKTIKSNYRRYDTKLEYNLGLMAPEIYFESEKKADRFIANDVYRKDSLLSTSFLFYDIQPGIIFALDQNAKAHFFYSYREDNLPFARKFKKASESKSFGASGDYQARNANLNFNLIWSQKNNLSDLNRDRINAFAARFFSRFIFFDNGLMAIANYEISTQRTSEYQKLFLPTQKGSGQYKYLGDLNNNGIQDEFEFRQTDFDGDYILIYLPTNNLKPTAELKTSAVFNYRFDKILSPDFFAYNIIRPISAETQIQIYENTENKNLSDIYLLNLSSFQKKEQTIRGNLLFRQEVKFFENYGDFSGKIRYRQNKGIHRFFEGIEKYLYKEISSLIYWKATSDFIFNNESSIIFDKSRAEKILTRNKDLIIKKTAFEFSYFPFKRLSVGFNIETQNGKDNFPEEKTKLNLYSQSIKLSYLTDNKSRATLEFQRAEVQTKQKNNYLPYELTIGNDIGINFHIRANFEFYAFENMTVAFNYDARKYARKDFIHIFRGEARAFF